MRRPVSLALTVILATVLSACASQPPSVVISAPQDGATIVLHPGQPVNLTIDPGPGTQLDRYREAVLLEVFDNSTQVLRELRIVGGDTSTSAPITWNGALVAWFPATLGDHVLQARIGYTVDNQQRHTDWAVAHVCVVGDPANPVNLPVGPSLFCDVAIGPTPQNLVIAPPGPQDLVLGSPTPHGTVAPPQQNTGHGNPNPGGSATGCGQYTDQSSCNLAGCSWDAQSSTCSITP